MRTITELSKCEEKVYLYLGNRSIAERFLMVVEREGFRFGDGVRPTERSTSDIFVINKDWSISYVGFIGHMAFKGAKDVGGRKLLRIDYERYILGLDDYLIQ